MFSLILKYKIVVFKSHGGRARLKVKMLQVLTFKSLFYKTGQNKIEFSRDVTKITDVIF